MDKVKTIAKYVTNILAIIAALVAGINAVDGITIPYAIQIVQVIAVIQGVIGTFLLSDKAYGTYLLSDKVVEKDEEKKED